MKQMIFIIAMGMGTFAFAAPQETSNEEITLEDLQQELMHELDTASFDDEDDSFLDEGIEKQIQVVQDKKTAVQKTATAPTTAPTTKK